MARDKTINMTEGPISKLMIRFALPVFFMSLFNQLYLITDSLIIATFTGDLGLGAVTNCENIYWFVTSFFFGCSMGLTVIISQQFGAGHHDMMKKAAATGLVAAFVMAILLIPVGLFLSAPILHIVQTPADVSGMSQGYLTIVLCGSGGLFLLNVAAGIFSGLGDSKTPLIFQTASCLANASMDVIFVALFHLGTSGAALATVLAQIGTGIAILFYLRSSRSPLPLPFHEIRLDRACFKELMRLGIPGGIENSAVSLANTMVQAFVNGFGTSAMAACGALATIDGFAFLPINAFCSALATFTGQNVGAAKKERTKKGVRVGLMWCTILSVVISILLLCVVRWALGFFLSSEESMALAIERAWITWPFYFICGLTHCLASVFRGAGKPMISMSAYLGFWGVLRVGLLMAVLPFIHSYAFLCWVYPITWSGSTIFLVLMERFYPWFPDSKKALEQLDLEKNGDVTVQ